MPAGCGKELTFQEPQARSLSGTSGFCAGSVVGFTSGFQFAALWAKPGKMKKAGLLQSKLHSRAQHAESVLHAAAEIDGRGLSEILRRTGDFSDAKTEVDALRQHLVVEHEVIGIFQQRQLGENFAAEGAVTGVIFRKLHAQEQIFEGRKESVRYIFIEWHAAQ